MMMQTTSKAAWKKLSLALLIPLLAATTLLLAECTSKEDEEMKEPTVSEQAQPVVETPAAEPETQTEPADDSEAIPFVLVETKPKFDGGDANQFSRWVNQRLHYPPEAKQKGLQGRVTLQFTVEKDGSVTGVKVLRGVHPLLDDEAVRVISESPKWTPGTVRGEPTRVVYNFPVVFQLSK
jgi:TonB family protein